MCGLCNSHFFIYVISLLICVCYSNLCDSLISCLYLLMLCLVAGCTRKGSSCWRKTEQSTTDSARSWFYTITVCLRVLSACLKMISFVFRVWKYFLQNSYIVILTELNQKPYLKSRSSQTISIDLHCFKCTLKRLSAD